MQENPVKKPHDDRNLPIGHQRNPMRDYRRRGIYLITLCTEGRKPLLGKLCGNSPKDATIEPSELGKEVLKCWRSIPSRQRTLATQKRRKTGENCRREIKLISYQLMPDHFHGILFVEEDMDIALGHVIHGFMVGCTKAYHKMIELENTPITQQIPASTFPAISRQPLFFNAAYSPNVALPPLWEKGYHDRPLTRNGQLRNMIEYLKDNPRRLFVRKHLAQYFHVQRGVRVGEHVFSAVGNMLLLDNIFHAVHVRRRFGEEERKRYMNDCILAARRGKVLVGAFISEYEKMVRDVAIKEGHGLIQLTHEAFSEYYKPSGDLFDACSRGQLLLLSPNAQPQAFSHRITREQCNQLNALAESFTSLS